MKVSNFKILLTCLIPVVLGVFVTMFFYSDTKADVYLFYDHSRYLDNIFNDVRNISISIIFSWYASRWKKNLFMPFFWFFLLELVLYFTVYKQGVSMVSLPFLTFLLILYNKK